MSNEGNKCDSTVAMEVTASPLNLLTLSEAVR